VRARGALADRQALGDLMVGGAGGHQAEHFQLPGGQPPDQALRAADRVGEQPGHGRVQVHPPGDRVPYGAGDLVGVGVFEQVPGGAGLECGTDLGLFYETCHDHDLHGGPAALDLRGGGDAVQDRHHQVHQHHIGQGPGRLEPGDAVQGLPAVTGLADHLDVGESPQVGR
jgi:hypothetical protein